MTERENDLFALPQFILLYDLTSTYWEGTAEGNPQVRRGYSRAPRPERSEAHIFPCVRADHRLHAIETAQRRQGEYRLWGTIRKELRTLQVVTVILPGSHGDVYEVRRAARPKPHQQALYQKLNLEDFFRRHRFGHPKRIS